VQTYGAVDGLLLDGHCTSLAGDASTRKGMTPGHESERLALDEEDQFTGDRFSGAAMRIS